MITNKLEIKTVRYVLSDCLFDNKENVHGFDMKRCRSCEYFTEPDICSYEEVIREVSNEGQVSDAYHYRTFDCATCGNKLFMDSAYSEIHKGERERCSKCDTLHTFVGMKDKKYIVAVPMQK